MFHLLRVAWLRIRLRDLNGRIALCVRHRMQLEYEAKRDEALVEQMRVRRDELERELDSARLKSLAHSWTAPKGMR